KVDAQIREARERAQPLLARERRVRVGVEQRALRLPGEHGVQARRVAADLEIDGVAGVEAHFLEREAEPDVGRAAEAADREALAFEVVDLVDLRRNDEIEGE